MAADMAEHLPDVLPVHRPKLESTYEQLYADAPVVVTLTFPAWTQADGAWIRAACRAALESYPSPPDKGKGKGPLSTLLHLEDLFGRQLAPIDADDVPGTPEDD